MLPPAMTPFLNNSIWLAMTPSSNLLSLAENGDAGSAIMSVIASFGLWAVVTVIAFLWVFSHLEQVEKIVSWIYRLFAWTHRTIKLKAVAGQIQSQVNVPAERLESEVRDVLAHPLKIQWITSGDPSSAIQEGAVVVRIRNQFDNAPNIVNVMMLYLSAGLLPSSRPYVDPTLMSALDLTIAWRMLVKSTEDEVSLHFLSNVFNPAVTD